jgi:hypothetical protein
VGEKRAAQEGKEVARVEKRAAQEGKVGGSIKKSLLDHPSNTK